MTLGRNLRFESLYLRSGRYVVQPACREPQGRELALRGSQGREPVESVEPVGRRRDYRQVVRGRR